MSKAIFVNQIGYLVDGFKAGYVTAKAAEAADGTFVLKTPENQIVYTGKLGLPVEDRIAGAPYCCADFSDFIQPGKYILSVGDNDSYIFEIGEKIYESLYVSILRYFTLSRCGCTVNHPVFGHEPCHASVAEIYGEPGKTKNVLGGWHDAGDYGRYVVAGTKTVLDLLVAYKALQMKGDKESLNLFDILDETRFELEWLLQMQREDGAVYHKISTYHFCGFITPEADNEKIVLAPVSTAATADFAGCLAYASMYYKDIDSAFADKLLAAATKAQDYLFAHEDELYKNPPKIRTGEYGDRNVEDERFLAAAGLFAATGKEEYKKAAEEIWEKAHALLNEGTICGNKHYFAGFGWGNVGAYGMEILIHSGRLAEDDPFRLKILESIMERAEQLMAKVNTASFGTSHEFVFWGSNGYVCDNAHILILAANFVDEEKRGEYYKAVQKHFNYILGCNPMGMCYVTGFGSESTKHPHHRPSGALKTLMPGMLAGGPAEGLVDPTIKEAYSGRNIAPLNCYLDHIHSYSSNEVAIYWNSPFVLLCACCM